MNTYALPELRLGAPTTTVSSASGPSPGRTPISVPRVTPSRQYSRLASVAAVEGDLLLAVVALTYLNSDKFQGGPRGAAAARSASCSQLK